MEEKEYLTKEETEKHRNILYFGLSIIILIFSFLILFFAFATTTEAATIYEYNPSRLTDEGGGNAFSNSNGIYVENSELSGITNVDSIRIYIGGSEGATPFNFRIRICEVYFGDNCQGSATNISSWSTETHTNNGTPDYYEFTIPDNWSFSNSRDGILIQINNTTTTGGVRVWGNASSTPYTTPTSYAAPSVNTYLALAYGGFPPSNTNTRIQWVNPPKTNPSATTSSSTIDFEFNYYINSATTSPESLSHIILSLCPLSYPNDACQKETITASTTWDSFTNVSKTITTNRLGYYLAIVSFWNGVTEETDCSWWEIFCNEETPILSYSVQNNFNVATTTIPADIPLSYESVSSQCADSNFAGEAICKTLLWIFYPSDASLDKYLNIGQVMQNKIPFSFFYIVKNELENISNTEASEGSNIVVNPMGFEFTLIDWQGMHDTYATMFVDTDVEKYLIYGLWISFAFFAFYKVESSIHA